MSDVGRTAVRPEYADLARALAREIVQRELTARVRTVVGVAGESGSGKSVTASSLARELAALGHGARVLHQDDYFFLPPHENHRARERDIGHVGPGEVNLSLMQSHVAAFRAGAEGLDAPAVDYVADRFDTRHVDLAGVAVLVVEGTYVLGLDNLDCRIFLEATYADTRDRRRARARDVDSPFVEQVLAIEHEIIARQAARADLVIDRQFAIVRA